MKLNRSTSSPCLAINDSEHLFKMIFNQQFQFMAILSVEGRVLDINDLAIVSQGLPREDFIGKFFWKLPSCCNFPEWEAIWKKRLTEAANQKEAVTTEDVYQLQDGSIHYVDASTMAIYDPSNGHLVGFITQAIDTTKHISCKNKIQENEEKLQFVLDHSHIGHWELNLSEHTSHRSLQHEQIFGYETLLPEWTYAMFLEHVIPEDRVDVDNKFKYAIEKQLDWDFECRILRKDGKIRWIAASGGHSFDKNGQAKVMAGIVQDITKLKRAETAKIRHNAELESLFNALPDIYFRMKNDGTIFDYHAQNSNELYVEPKEFLGKRMQDILPKEIGELFLVKINEIACRKKMVSFTYQLQVGEKPHYFDARINRIDVNEQLICVIRDVTEEVTSKQSLAISELRFRTIFEQAAIGVALTSFSSGKFIRINKCFCDMLGYRTEEMLNGRRFRDITHPDDLNKSLHYIDKIQGGDEREITLEKRYLHKKGHIVWVEVNVSPTCETGEVPDTFIVIAQDISERKKADEAIKVKQKQLLQAESIGKMGSWELDLQSLTSVCSSEIYNILNVSLIPDNAILFLKNVVFPEDWHKVKSALRNTIKLGVLCEIEFRILQPNKAKRWVYCKVERQNDTVGNASKLVGILQDITNRMQQEEQQRLTAAVYKNTSEGVMITNAQGIIVDVNQAFCRLTGYSAEDVIGKNPRLLKSNKQTKTFYSKMWKSLLSTGQWTGEIWNRRKDGSQYPELLNISRITDDKNNVTHFIGVFSDISHMKRSEEALYHLAHHDALTGLPNRLLLKIYLKDAIKRAKRKKSFIAVIFFDLDNFKIINDSFGHSTGDILLQETAQRLLNSVRENDSVSRISGDEFIIIMEDIYCLNDASVAVNKLLNVFQKKFILKKQHVNITASMGACLYPQDADNPEDLLRNADTAMYQAKDFGRNSYKFYNREMTNNAFERVQLENSLRQAIEADEFYLNYQPQISLTTNEIIGLEVLIRWNHKTLGIVPPVDFIPLAEETGLIIDIGEWVLSTACAQAKEWLDCGIKFGRIAINVAGPQIRHGNIVSIVKKVLIETGLPAQYLELEVTESYIMQQKDQAIEQMQEIQDMGIMLSIDDFGTGYSSLSYLKKLPINKLKIDRSFVRDIPEDKDDMAISKAVIALGTALGLKVIAEGVETKEQAHFLAEAGCHEVQGYLYSRPIDKEAVECFLVDYVVV